MQACGRTQRRILANALYSIAIVAHMFNMLRGIPGEFPRLLTLLSCLLDSIVSIDSKGREERERARRQGGDTCKGQIEEDKAKMGTQDNARRQIGRLDMRQEHVQHDKARQETKKVAQVNSNVTDRSVLRRKDETGTD